MADTFKCSLQACDTEQERKAVGKASPLCPVTAAGDASRHGRTAIDIPCESDGLCDTQSHLDVSKRCVPDFLGALRLRQIVEAPCLCT